MARGRESKSATLGKMIRVLQAVNALSPHDPSQDGEPITLEKFAQVVGLSPSECARIIAKINYGCGDALPAAFVDLDEDGGVIVPHRLVFAFDGLLRLSRPEAYALLVALRSSGIDADGRLANALRGALPEIDLERFASVGEDPRVPTGALGRIADAIASRAVLAIDYRDADGNETHREVEPLAVWYDTAQSTWLFSAWCRLRNSMRVFRCDRIGQTPAPTGETFEPRSVDDPLGPLNTLEDAPAAILAVRDPRSLAPTGTWRGLEAVQEPTAEQLALFSDAEIASGAFIATIPWVKGSSWLPRAVVATLGGVEVLQPADLREEVHGLAATLLAQLGD